MLYIRSFLFCLYPLFRWGTGLANTGSISPKQLAANIKYYKDGITHFAEVIQRVKQAYATGSTTTEHPEFDFDGIIPRLVKEGKVTDPIVLGGNCLMWLLGGFHNPANLSALAVGMLLSHPSQLDKLRTHAREVMGKPNGAANLSSSLRQVSSFYFVTPPSFAPQRLLLLCFPGCVRSGSLLSPCGSPCPFSHVPS